MTFLASWLAFLSLALASSLPRSIWIHRWGDAAVSTVRVDAISKQNYCID